MPSEAHIKAIMDLPTVELASIIQRLKSELQRRGHIAETAANRPRITLRPE